LPILGPLRGPAAMPPFPSTARCRGLRLPRRAMSWSRAAP